MAGQIYSTTPRSIQNMHQHSMEITQYYNLSTPYIIRYFKLILLCNTIVTVSTDRYS
uniref:Uncharacterized protein n=1 Tax=Triticum urartu TaxID=4572 RepID=A0A8R7PVD9_TRIUA